MLLSTSISINKVITFIWQVIFADRDGLLAEWARILLFDPGPNALRMEDMLYMTRHLAYDGCSCELILTDSTLEARYFKGSNRLGRRSIPPCHVEHTLIVVVSWTLLILAPAGIASRGTERVETAVDDTLVNLFDRVEPNCFKGLLVEFLKGKSSLDLHSRLSVPNSFTKL